MASTPPQPSGPVRYRIVIRGRVTDRLAASFDGMTIEPGPTTSTLVGPIIDQSHLLGIVQAIAGLGLELVSLTPDPERGVDEHSRIAPAAKPLDQRDHTPIQSPRPLRSRSDLTSAR